MPRSATLCQGEVVPEDQAEAVIWYTEAARHGDAKALFKLGEAYERAAASPSIRSRR